MQASKLLKRSRNIVFSNSNLALKKKQQSYKIVDELKALLTKIPYSEVTWQTKSLNIWSIITNITPKIYLIYYFDIIPTIQFLISHWAFTLHMAFVQVRYYSTNNLDNNDIDSNKDKRIYREIRIADWWWITQKVFIDSGVKNATIILVLLVIDNTILIKHAENIDQ